MRAKERFRVIIMSSWANIRVPRKRDLSQIPAELRPSIVPRADRVEVRMSESFQQTAYDPVDYPIRNVIEEPYNRRDMKANQKQDIPVVRKGEYVSKRIEIAPSPGAFELRFQNKSYVFVILRHIRTARDNDLWIHSYNSIRKFYTNKIIIIDDNSLVNTVNGKLFNAEVISSEFPGAGEILPYYYFLQHHWADTMIFLHDSMFLHRTFRDDELHHSAIFHWHFTSNGLDDNRKIHTYISLLENSKGLLEFYKHPTSVWKGCSGGTMIIDYDVVRGLEDKYKLFSMLTMSIKIRKDRESFERVMGVICYYEGLIQDVHPSNFGDILRYPGAFESENNNPETALHVIQQRGYDTAIVKVWRGR
jgi:hypothetical protein